MVDQLHHLTASLADLAISHVHPLALTAGALLAIVVSCDWLGRWLGLPRISLYVLSGTLFAAVWLAAEPVSDSTPARAWASWPSVVAELALAAMSFELATQARLAWMRANPWLLLTCVADALAGVGIAAGLHLGVGLPLDAACIAAALLVGVSPAVVLLVINGHSASGQVTHRLVLLTVVGCVTSAVLVSAGQPLAQLLAGYAPSQVLSSALFAICGGLLLGSLAGLALASPALEGAAPRSGGLVAFLCATLAAGLALQLEASLLLTLTIAGLVFAARRQSPRSVSLGGVSHVVSLVPGGVNPGLMLGLAALALGVSVGFQQLSVLAASTQEMPTLASATGVVVLVLGLLLARVCIKALVILPLAHASGLRWHKALALSLACAPITGLPTVLLASLGMSWLMQLSASSAGLGTLLAGVLLLEATGPLLTRWALARAGDIAEAQALRARVEPVAALPIRNVVEGTP